MEVFGGGPLAQADCRGEGLATDVDELLFILLLLSLVFAESTRWLSYSRTIEWWVLMGKRFVVDFLISR